MPYGKLELITAADYNQIREDVGEVFNDRNSGIGYPFIISPTGASSDMGYGVPHISSTVLVGDIITAEDWNNLFDEIYNCALHQGTNTGEVQNPVLVGNIIEAYEDDGPSAGLLQLIDDIRDNRLIFDPTFFNITSGGSMLVSERTSNWGLAQNPVQHQFRVDFNSFDDMRYFFNSGGQIRMSASFTNDTVNSEGDAWETELATMGDIHFKLNETTLVGDATNYPIGMYDLQESTNLLIFTRPINTDLYGGDDVLELRASFPANVESTPRITFTLDFIANLSQSNNVNLDGTLRVEIDKREAVTYVPPPNTLVSGDFTTIIELSD